VSRIIRIMLESEFILTELSVGPTTHALSRRVYRLLPDHLNPERAARTALQANGIRALSECPTIHPEQVRDLRMPLESSRSRVGING
jgi:hypothetical protein